MSSASPSLSSGRRLARLPWPALAVVVAPVLGIVLLRAPLINTLNYNDTWFYSGYGWTPAHHVEIFDWFYYGVRFPVTLPIHISTDLFGATAGYLALRALIFSATGAIVYGVLRRVVSMPIACVGVLLLCLDSFYLRLILWDYTTFVTLPCSIAGAALWYLGAEGRRPWLTAFVAGVFLAAAMFANPVSVMVLFALFGVEAVAAARNGWLGVREYLLRLAVVALAAVAVLAAGYLGYASTLGWFRINDLIQPTLDFLRNNSQLVTAFEVPARVFLRNEPRIYAPVLVCLATVIVLRHRILENTVDARLAQFAVAYTSVFWVYRKFVPSSVIEQWLSYHMTAVTACFAMPLILEELRRREGRRSWLLPAVALASWGVSDLVIRSLGARALPFYDHLKTNLVLLVALLALGVVGAAVLALDRGPARPAALAVFAAVVAVLSLAPAVQQGIGQPGDYVVEGALSYESWRNSLQTMTNQMPGRPSGPTCSG
jgi:hypothetical protein